jgi:predicted dehydrogenase
MSPAAHKPATYRDYHELLARKDIDAVVIATPCDLHVEMILLLNELLAVSAE